MAIYPIPIAWSYPVLCFLFSLFISGPLLFTIIICLKVKLGNLSTQNIYLKYKKKIRDTQKPKASLYEASLVPSNGATSPRGYGFILNQEVRKIEEYISFLDGNMSLYKQDFQSFINTLCESVR